MDDEMASNAQWDAHLETLARLVEATAKTGKEAAKLIRNAKTCNANKDNQDSKDQ